MSHPLANLKMEVFFNQETPDWMQALKRAPLDPCTTRAEALERGPRPSPKSKSSKGGTGATRE